VVCLPGITRNVAPPWTPDYFSIASNGSIHFESDMILDGLQRTSARPEVAPGLQPDSERRARESQRCLEGGPTAWGRSIVLLVLRSVNQLRRAYHLAWAVTRRAEQQLRLVLALPYRVKRSDRGADPPTHARKRIVRRSCSP
jgi:hypothetical protein